MQRTSDAFRIRSPSHKAVPGKKRFNFFFAYYKILYIAPGVWCIDLFYTAHVILTLASDPSKCTPGLVKFGLDPALVLARADDGTLCWFLVLLAFFRDI